MTEMGEYAREMHEDAWLNTRGCQNGDETRIGKDHAMGEMLPE